VTLDARKPAFVGRSEENRLLGEILESVRSGAGRAVLIEGEPGIGKTRLVQEMSSQAERDGFQVLRGECDEAARVRPFAPLAQALAQVRSFDDGDSALAEILEGNEGGAAAGPSPATQYRAIEAVGALVERLATEKPLILVIEDLHWADGSTLVALRSLGRRIERTPVLLVGTTRPGRGLPELQGVMDVLIRAGGRHVALGPLDDEAVAHLASDLLGADAGPSILGKLRGTAGNPLFVIEYTSALVEAGNVELGEGTADIAEQAYDALPTEFRQSALRRITQLSDEAVQVIRIASILGSAFSPKDLAVVLARSSVSLAPLLQEAVDARVITDHGARLSFLHDLVREAVYESIPAALRKQLHREIGLELAAAGAEPLAVAHHLGLGAEERDEEAASWLRRAARAVAARAPEVSVSLLERARELVGPADPQRNELQADLVMPLAWSGRLGDAEAVARQVLARHPPAKVAGPLRCGLVYALAWQGRPAEALEYTKVDPDDPLTQQDAVLLRAHGAVAKMFSFDLRGAGADATAVVEEAERVGHDLALCTALCVQTFLLGFSGNTQQAIATGRRAVAVADHSTDAEAQLAAPRFFLGLPLIAADLLEEAEDVLQTGRRVAEELGHAWSLPLFHAYHGTVRFVSGEWDDAIAEFEASLAIADEVGIRMIAFAAVVSWLAVIRIHRGDLEAAEELLARAEQRVAEAGPQVGMSLLAWGRALLHEARGNVEVGLAALQSAWDFSVMSGLQAEPWSGAALVRMYARNGQPERATDTVPVIEAQATNNPTPFMKGRGLASRGLTGSDPDLLMQAVETYRECPRPHELALACEDAGTLLAQAERSEEALPYLDEAIEIYDTLGATRDGSRARATLRSLGIKRGSRRQRARATHGWESLTETELKVAALVAQRFSNPEVAERLFISRHTVESHLKNIYAKLGVGSRIELAKEAARQNPSPAPG
jgi:DNA-binding CsgD family transcriptional regulator